MRIDRLLLIGIVALAIAIVVVTTTLLTVDMLKMSRSNLEELNAVASSVKDQNTTMFQDINRTATEVGDDIWDITDTAATEQLKNIGENIGADIKAVMDGPFVSVKNLVTMLLFEKTEAEDRGETPDRKRVEKMLRYYLEQNEDISAVITAWEKNAFDGKDAEFVGKEKPDAGAEITNEEYVSEGAFIPWLFKDEDESGKEVVLQGVLDDYLTGETGFYTVPRETKKDFITEPQTEKDSQVVTFCSPILRDDIFLGMAGIDINLARLQEIVRESKPFESGFAMLCTPEGHIVYHPEEKINYTDGEDTDGEPALVCQNIEKVDCLKETARYIKEGKTEIYTSTTMTGVEGEKMLVKHVPIFFGDDPNAWTVVVVAPESKVMQGRNNAKNSMDEMVAGIDKQNVEFVGKLDDQVKGAVDRSEEATRLSFRNSILVGLIVLVISVAIGGIFATRVNRSINARDFRYRQILDVSNDPISVVDTAMKIMFVNKPGLALLKKSLDECVGRDVSEIWKPMIGAGYDRCGIRLLQSKGQNLSMVEFNADHWDVASQYIVDNKGAKDGIVEIFNKVSDRENIFQMIERVDEVIRATVEQTNSIAQASEDLIRGADEQARSVESITSHMKIASEQTQGNADSAEQANRLSGDAAGAATLGQKRMQEMSGAMNQISDNAQNMRAVIKTIDDIAFQTNLLALNAAVEAARAGTHGKGFAVVAEEVRNLAARSAKAAKETEELILKSNQQIEGGVSIADQTADALNSIAGHVGGVSDLISRITVSSREQSGSVARMTETLHDVDRVTRQNLDLASTTSNAARLLSSEVQELQNLMERLRKKDS